MAHSSSHRSIAHFQMGYDPFVRALMRFSHRAPAKPLPLPTPEETALDLDESDYDLPVIPSSRFYADPIAPLRSRDETALDEIFQTEHLGDIVDDVHHRLQQLYPEPCWEDEPFDFLRGYL